MALTKNPKLALIPNGYKASKVYSVLPSDGVGDFYFSRDTIATRVNKQGLIETVSSNVPRLNYPLIDGVVSGCPSLLLEPTKQNVLQKSEEFDNAYWINNGVTINANQTISPSGQLNADLLTGVSGGLGVVRFSTWSATNKVASCFVKKGSSNLFKISNASLTYIGVTFNLEDGTVTNEDSGFEGSIENYGNGWFRCTAIDTLARSGTFSLGVTAASESVYMWGAQLESDYKTSYIPTTTAAATRSAETCTGAGDATTFNDSQGVLMVEISAFDNTDTSNRFISILNGTDINNGFYMFYGGATNQIRFQYKTSSDDFNFITTNYNTEDINKIAFKYKSNDISVWINGFELVNDTTISSTPTNLNNLAFDRAGSEDFYGNVKQIQYFDTALTDAELQALTSE